MNATELQQHLFATIKSKIPEHLSAPEEIAKMLEVSVDSVYRRIRGEKAITLDELHLLCDHYKISLDQLLNIHTGAFLFQGNLLDSKNFRFEEYLSTTLRNMTYFKNCKQNEFYYLCKDLPFFYHFFSKELAAFKYYFWMSTLIFFPEFRNKKVSVEEYPGSLFEIGKKTMNVYYQMNTFELWTLESINSTIRQIDYYVDGQMFSHNSDAFKVYEAIISFLNHLEQQAQLGYRFLPDDPEKKPMGNFFMYFNEIVLPDNSMMAVMDNSKIAIMPHTAANYMMTRDIAYCENYYRYTHNLMKRSTLISQVSEKERTRFFRLMREKVQNRQKVLKP